MEKLLLKSTKTIDIEDTLASFSLSLLDKKNEEEVVWGLIENCTSTLGFGGCIIYFVDGGTNELVQRAAYCQKDLFEKKLALAKLFPIGKSIASKVASTGIPLIVQDVTKDSGFPEHDGNSLSELCVPIKEEDRVIGIIDCEHVTPDFFTNDHLFILAFLAKICALKLNQLRNEQKRMKQMEDAHQANLLLAQIHTKRIKSHLNTHFVFNTLNSIQYFIIENNKELALNYLTIFGKIIRYYLGNFENNLVHINEEMDALKNYLTLQKLRYEDGFIYQILPDISVSQENQVPPLLIITIAEEILENHLSDTGSLYLNISTRSEDKGLLISFEYEYPNEKRISSGYRTILSWKDQVTYLNDANGWSIEYNVKNESLNKNKFRSKLSVLIPQ